MKCISLLEIFDVRGDIMGGQEGLRGYLYQGVVAIIKALNENGWNSIAVEYNSPMDKVDIALLNDEKIVSAIQVKSSINLFEKKDVAQWIKNIIDDVDADVYELYLLGTPQEDANVFINSIGQYYKKISTHKMQSSLGDFVNVLSNHVIKISVLPITQETLMANVRDALNCYISKKGYQVKYEILDSLTKLIIGADMLLATSGSCISKSEYDNRLFDWLNLSCGNMMKSDNYFSSIEALFYFNGIFCEKIAPISIRSLSTYRDLIKKSDDNIKAHIEQMLGIDVYKEDEPFEIGGKAYMPIENPLKLNKAECIPYTVDSDVKEGIEHVVAELLNIELENDFWDFGGLVKKELVEGKAILLGTTRQKNKEQLLWKLIPKISERVGYENYASAFEDICILPIVLKNNGSIANQKIMITLKIPKNSVELVDIDSIVDSVCVNLEIAKSIIDEDLTRKVWMPKEDDKISWEGIGYNFSDIDIRINFNKNNLSLYKEKILSELKSYIEYDIVYDDSNIIIKWEIDNIRPDECVMLGKYLVFKRIEHGTEINYDIISQQAPKRLEGRLLVE